MVLLTAKKIHLRRMVKANERNLQCPLSRLPKSALLEQATAEGVREQQICDGRLQKMRDTVLDQSRNGRHRDRVEKEG